MPKHCRPTSKHWLNFQALTVYCSKSGLQNHCFKPLSSVQTLFRTIALDVRKDAWTSHQILWPSKKCCGHPKNVLDDQVSAARACFLTPKHFCLMCQKIVGRSPQKMLNHFERLRKYWMHLISLEYIYTYPSTFKCS